jgi:hypothetical protein
MVNTISFPILLGEVAFLLWLLIIGPKLKPEAGTAGAVRKEGSL